MDEVALKCKQCGNYVAVYWQDFEGGIGGVPLDETIECECGGVEFLIVSPSNIEITESESE